MKNEGRHEESVLIRYLFISQHLLSTYCLPGYMLEIRDTKMNIIVVSIVTFSDSQIFIGLRIT